MEWSVKCCGTRVEGLFTFDAELAGEGCVEGHDWQVFDGIYRLDKMVVADMASIKAAGRL